MAMAEGRCSPESLTTTYPKVKEHVSIIFRYHHRPSPPRHRLGPSFECGKKRSFIVLADEGHRGVTHRARGFQLVKSVGHYTCDCSDTRESVERKLSAMKSEVPGGEVVQEKMDSL